MKKGNYVLVLNLLQSATEMQEHFAIMGYNFQSDQIEEMGRVYQVALDNHPYQFSVTIK